MTVQQFIDLWDIKLSPPAQQLCHIGLEILEKSTDPTHDLSHVEALLDNANYLITHERLDQKKLKFEVLTLAITWHDVWKSAYVPKNVVQLFYSFYWDGLGSSRLFETHARRVGLDLETKKATSYAIRKHHSVQFLPRNTLESKILKDCDELELWSLGRAQVMYEHALTSLTKLGMKKLMRRYLKMKLKNSAQTVYFATTQVVLEHKMKIFLKEFDDEIATF